MPPPMGCAETCAERWQGACPEETRYSRDRTTSAWREPVRDQPLLVVLDARFVEQLVATAATSSADRESMIGDSQLRHDQLDAGRARADALRIEEFEGMLGQLPRSNLAIVVQSNAIRREVI